MRLVFRFLIYMKKRDFQRNDRPLFVPSSLKDFRLLMIRHRWPLPDKDPPSVFLKQALEILACCSLLFFFVDWRFCLRIGPASRISTANRGFTGSFHVLTATYVPSNRHTSWRLNFFNGLCSFESNGCIQGKSSQPFTMKAEGKSKWNLVVGL